MQESETISELEKKLSESAGDEKLEVLKELLEEIKDTDPAKTIEFCEMSVDLLKDSQDTVLRSYYLNKKGRMLFSIGEFHKALKCFLFDLEENYVDGDQAHRASMCNRIGAMYLRISDYSKALDYFMEALKIREELNDREGMAHALSNIGSTIAESDQSKALEYFQRAQKILKDLGNSELLWLANANLSVSLYDLKQYDKALEYAEDALEIAKTTGNENDQGNSFLAIGNAYVGLGLPEKGIEALAEALRLKRATGDKFREAYILLSMAEVNVELDNDDKALELALESLELVEKLEVKYSIMKCYDTISQIHEKTSRFKKALEYNKKYTEIKLDISSENNTNKYNELLVAYETETKEKEKEIYRLKNVELVEANEGLKQALIQVKTLRGLLPICSSCKNIRSDDGYWASIEVYIGEHSEAEFTHGICPDCAEKLYPELFKKDD